LRCGCVLSQSQSRCFWLSRALRLQHHDALTWFLDAMGRRDAHGRVVIREPMTLASTNSGKCLLKPGTTFEYPSMLVPLVPSVLSGAGTGQDQQLPTHGMVASHRLGAMWRRVSQRTKRSGACVWPVACSRLHAAAREDEPVLCVLSHILLHYRASNTKCALPFV
jgi:hypothetical protein